MPPKESTNRVFLVHGWASSPEDCWFPWIRKKLEEDGFAVCAPAFPNPRRPDPSAWVRILSDAVGTPDKNTYFVGHSLGGYVILAYLESLSDSAEIGGAVIVGSCMAREGLRPIDVGRIRRFGPRVRALFSDNDYYIPLEEERRFRDELGAETFILKNKGHFSRKENTRHFPEAHEILMSLAGRV